MHIRPVIPVKLLPDSKSRLQQVLTPAERQGLTRYLLRRLLMVLGEVAGLGQPLVVSRDTAVAQIAHTAHAALYREHPAAGLNGALTEARAHLRQSDPITTHLLILPSDLPLVQAADVAQVMGVVGKDTAVVIVSDQRQTGTNSLLLPIMAPFTLHYGPHSFQQHQQEAIQNQLPYAVLKLPRLQFDLDTAQDWCSYQTQQRR